MLKGCHLSTSLRKTEGLMPAVMPLGPSLVDMQSSQLEHVVRRYKSRKIYEQIRQTGYSNDLHNFGPINDRGGRIQRPAEHFVCSSHRPFMELTDCPCDYGTPGSRKRIGETRALYHFCDRLGSAHAGNRLRRPRRPRV